MPLSRAAQYFHTLRHLRAVQWYGRVWQRLARVLPPPSRPNTVRVARPQSDAWVDSPVRRRVHLGDGRIDLLGVTVDTRAADLWQAHGLTALQAYNLHYFEELGGALPPEAVEFYRSLVDTWIRDNPARASTAWSAYPMSRRVVNWIKADLRYDLLDARARASLYQQVAYLRPRLETHLQGNHLWCNAKALVFAGLYFGARDGAARAGRWFRRGMAMLRREFDEQIRRDGSHYEQSVMYQALALEDLLDLIALLRAYRVAPPAEWLAGVPRMLAFTRAFTHADGDPVLFNDAAAGIAPTLDELADYAAALDFPASAGTVSGPWFPDAGWCRLEHGPWTLFMDAGPIGPDHLPAHAHADTLTLELDHAGHRLLVDSGTGEYGDSARRHRQRSTAAHNTVEVDGLDSSEVWGGFRVARRANVTGTPQCTTGPGGPRCTAAHDGYRRLRDPVTHRRDVIVETNSVRILDQLSGIKEHSMVGNWHLAPEISATPHADGSVRLTNPLTSAALQIRVRAFTRDVADDAVRHPLPLTVATFEWSPRFGTAIQAQVLSARHRAPTPLLMETVFEVIGSV